MSDPILVRAHMGTAGVARWALHVRTYLREMYPPLPRLVYATVWFYALYLGLAAYHGTPSALLAPAPVAGALTWFFFLLFLRLSDELKDAESDKLHFPERSVPSGVVPLRRVREMWAASLVIMVLLQIPAGGPNSAFLVLMGYALLMFRYFFLRRWIASSLPLALVTHNPVGFLLQLYGVWLFSEVSGVSPLQPFHLALAFLFWIPALIWEVARKIRAPDQETAYQTYSGILGPRRAAALVAAGAAGFAALGLGLGGAIGLGVIGRSGLALAALAFVWKCVRFIAQPNAERSRLQPAAELWIMISLVAWCVDLVLSH